ncbi:TPA: hypothetical protein ACFNMI_002171 [Neisseria bacilliformis]|uniref:hypothetical protein n=1 Tax=Neisseria bacilliformis TaxID=267212 RepID=UPI0006695F30|nr:hypothetical protein [Neisseria bacilliformis]
MSKPNLFYCAALALLWAYPAAACNPHHNDYHSCIYHQQRLAHEQQLQFLQQQQQRQAQSVPKDHLSQQCTPR